MHWTDEQRAVIHHQGGHAIVTAVAGSGKTSTLVAHVLHQLEQGQDPSRMLVLMFNRSAREDFERKLAKSLTSHVRLPDIRTYHSMGLRLYQSFAKEGLLPSWHGDPLSNVRMELECWKILTRIAPASMQDSLKNNKSSWVSDMTGFIDLVKSTTRSPEQVFEEYDFDSRKKLLLEGYHAFESWRLEQGLITYADMLYQPVMLMLRQPELVKRVTNRMDLMLVDEYQDTNEVQHTLLRMIAGRRAQVMVVGDPDQTIYEFRGARPEYILRTFAEDFPNPTPYTLSYTFRYGHTLALVADHLIINNAGRTDTLCIAHSSTPETRVERVEESDHARWLVARVSELQQDGYALSDIAVLVRLWSQSVTLELALLEQGIPFNSDGEKSAFDRQEIELLMALTELAAGRFRALTVEKRYQKLWQILRFPHIGIKEQWLKGFCRQLAEREDGFGRWMMKQAEGYLDGLSDFQKTRVLERGRQLLRMEQGGDEPTARLLQRYILAVELKRWLIDSALDRDRAEEQLLAIDSFNRYLAKTKMAPAATCELIDDLQQRRKANNRNKSSAALVLTSMHKSKGLEWPVVILPSLIEKQLPCSIGDDALEPVGLEAERRLFYVAMTRAREHLILMTTPLPSAKGGSAERMPSRFMTELRDRLSCEAGEQLHKLCADTSAADERTLTIHYPRSEVLQRYIATECPDVQLVQGANLDKTELVAGLPWQKKEVTHSIFGEGIVLSETGTDFKVRFIEDGSVYDFSKKSAHLYFA
ncbi:ATP-dependent helicase [Parendozoicomonas haliclonae]|uniref:DNA 3'-5' helicase n=1 Tax=Parendozoicomonas haliclonae TaxID=1960125 RepID=A0A1X7AKF0_9GAMM|nr:ATP-dependent helicase [Parendozoicomonas haliclonae]SMA47199.1 ATP-dependent DNA helicase PcrA [Parendozoicomonas haliclonae]